MEGADADKLTPLFFEHYMLTDHIDDVGPFLDGFDRAGVEARQAQARLLRGLLECVLLLGLGLTDRLGLVDAGAGVDLLDDAATGVIDHACRWFLAGFVQVSCHRPAAEPKDHLILHVGADLGLASRLGLGLGLGLWLGKCQRAPQG